jgi:hypothetical protein
MSNNNIQDSLSPCRDLNPGSSWKKRVYYYSAVFVDRNVYVLRNVDTIVCSLLNDAFSDDYIASNERMIRQ